MKNRNRQEFILQKKYFAYIRISTSRQSAGVSLIEQRSAIERFAIDHELQVTEWFKEIETAAKRGRPIFKALLQRIERGQAEGLIIHKIDRGARNLKDWSDLGELIDRGVDVRFAHDNLDLETRGGRLAADIQAVIAADYIRNLREEVRKGIVGRLRQGLYPLRAPLGYLDRGSGRAKGVDPSRATLIAKAFERYATGAYTLGSLSAELANEGLTNRLGRRLTLNNLAHILHNPFYAGIIKFSSMEESYLGVHEPIIEPKLFEAVATRFRERRPRKARLAHSFTYRGRLTCGSCRRSLIGERHRRYTYYRCHQPSCRGTNVTEGAVSVAINREFGRGAAALPCLDELAITVTKKQIDVSYQPPVRAEPAKKFDSPSGLFAPRKERT